MKLTKNILPVLILALLAMFCATPARAQFDFYARPRIVIVTPPTLLGTTIYSNKPVDVRGLTGTACLSVTCQTNGAAGAFTVSLYKSPDLTNWTAVANASYASSYTANLTNNQYAAQLVGTNAYYLAGTVTTPTATTAGFATSYLLSAPFTNSATGISLAAGGNAVIGFNIADADRYFSVQYAPSANNTNQSVSATLIAQPESTTIIR